MAAKRKKLTTKHVRESLEAQLREKGADVPHFQDQLDRYMFFRKTYLALVEDIETNGNMIQVVSASGKECDRENPAIKQAAVCDQRMSAILKEMGLTTESCRPPEDEGGDLG